MSAPYRPDRLRVWTHREIIDRHIDGVGDIGVAYQILHKRPWVIRCYWCLHHTDKHLTKRGALAQMSAHYDSLIPGWCVTNARATS